MMQQYKSTLNLSLIKLPIDTKIAYAFFNLGFKYEKRNCIDLALENYKKALEYDSSLNFIKACINNALLKQNKKPAVFKKYVTTVNNFDKKVPNGQIECFPYPATTT